jgi:hypothetical protein
MIWKAAAVFLVLAQAAHAQSGTSTATSSSGSGAQALISNNSVSRIPKQSPGAFAPGMAVGADTCALSTGLGVSTPVGGFSFGTAHVDESCDVRAFARTLHGMGQQRAALAMMCQSARVKEAMIVIGTPCPGSPGYNPGPLAARTQAAANPDDDPFFYDKRGRKYLPRSYPNEAAARRDGARRSVTGEWVKLVN